MQWPALRFEKFYASYQKRLVVEELTNRKLGMISALYSNSNYDGDNAKIREQIIERYEEQFNVTIRALYNGADSQNEPKLKDNPFFGAMERGLKEQGVPTVEEMEKIKLDEEKEKFLPDDMDIDQT